MSPNYPNSFPAFSHCIWRVSAPGNYYISLRFTEFLGLNGTNPSCPLDYVQVLDGFTNKSPQLGKISTVVIKIIIFSWLYPEGHVRLKRKMKKTVLNDRSDSTKTKRHNKYHHITVFRFKLTPSFSNTAKIIYYV